VSQSIEKYSWTSIYACFFCSFLFQHPLTPVDSKSRICYKTEVQNDLLRDAQHLHCLKALTDTIRWLVTSIGRHINVWDYRLLTGTMNIYLKGSYLSIPLLCGM